jgi:hypothetical protein
MPQQASSASKTARLLSAAATTNATSVLAESGTVRHISLRNAKAAAVFLKLYDKASAPTVGTDTPRMTIHIPATSDYAQQMDMYFSQGIAYALTTAAADADTGALVAADVICLNINYT